MNEITKTFQGGVYGGMAVLAPGRMATTQQVRTYMAGTSAARRYWDRDCARLNALRVGESCQINTGCHPRHGETETTVTRTA